jgi:hypothetical protein
LLSLSTCAGVVSVVIKVFSRVIADECRPLRAVWIHRRANVPIV